jgi:hypothetical protein
MQVLQSGLVMELEGGFEAFVPISEMSEERIKHPGDMHKEGDEISGYVLSIDSAKRRIRVSLRRSSEDAQQHGGGGGGHMGRHAEPMISDIKPTAGKVTLGDILAGKLDLTAAAKKEKDDEPAGDSGGAQDTPPAESPAVIEDQPAPSPAAETNQPQPADETAPTEESETGGSETDSAPGREDADTTETSVPGDVVGEGGGQSGSEPPDSTPAV